MRRYLSVIIFFAVSMASSHVCAQKVEHPHPANKFLSVKNAAEYSPTFLKAFEKGPTQVRIEDSLFIMNGDTDYFPTGLVLDRQYRFAGECQGEVYQLDVVRANYTNLKYRFAITSKAGLRYNREGTAILDTGFWIAAQPIEDEEDSVESGGCAYFDKDKDCEYELTIDDAPNEKGHLLASIQQTCSKKKNEISLCLITLLAK